MFTKTATAVIDSAALQHNFSQLRRLSPNSRILSVLKANAYGHGLERIAKSLIDTDAIGVARIDEALSLRAGGITKSIVLLEGFFDATDLPILSVNGFEAVVHNLPQLEALENANLATPVKVWLKIDTGMHRLGIAPQQFDEFYQRLTRCANVQKPIVLMSHLACADEPENSHTEKQIALFSAVTSSYAEEKSLANSAGTLSWPETRYEWVRPGLLLFGVSPMITGTADDINFKPVMTLKSKVIAVRQLAAGDTVGYGAAWQSTSNTQLAVVAIGYGDGYPRHAPSGTPVLINGKVYPMVGRVSMDMITVDIGEDHDIQIGDSAVLWGKGLPIEKIANHATTIPYELLCNITKRVHVEVI